MGGQALSRAPSCASSLGERLNLNCSKVGNPPIYDNAVFPWTKEIEREWRAIRAELDRVLTRKDDLPGFHEIASDVATISQDRGWKTFLLSGYGFKSDANIAPVPGTWAVVPEDPRPDHGDVLDPRAGQASAAASRTL